jgi:hypothetical protein
VNVAISRAQALAIVVTSQTLLDGTPGRLQDMRLYNLFHSLKREGKQRTQFNFSHTMNRGDIEEAI